MATPASPIILSSSNNTLQPNLLLKWHHWLVTRITSSIPSYEIMEIRSEDPPWKRVAKFVLALPMIVFCAIWQLLQPAQVPLSRRRVSFSPPLSQSVKASSPVLQAKGAVQGRLPIVHSRAPSGQLEHHEHRETTLIAKEGVSRLPRPPLAVGPQQHRKLPSRVVSFVDALSPAASSVHSASLEVGANRTLLAPHLFDESWTKLEAAAKRGDVEAQYQMGRRLALDALSRDEALRLLYTAACQGCAGAQYDLSVLYIEKCGICAPSASDVAESWRWLQESAAQSFPDAQYRMGYCLSNPFNAYRVSPNFREAVRCFQLAAEQGQPNAASCLGHAHWKGKYGLEKDAEKAARYFQMAIDDARSMRLKGRPLYLPVYHVDGDEQALKQLQETSSRA
jgi:hypothetical protein